MKINAVNKLMECIAIKEKKEIIKELHKERDT